MSQIPHYFIQNLLSHIDIVDLIQARLPLKKKGANYWGLCPFHNENSPSFSVSAQKQFYHCFGCGKHDNAIGFLMDYEHLTFPESIEELARMAGLEVPREEGSMPQISYAPLYVWMKKAKEYYEAMLRLPENKRAVDYLKQRGLNGHTAKKFELGFATPAWEGLLSHLKPAQNEIKELLEVDLLSQNETGKTYDRFRNRIMFPIRDKRGRVIGFGGRIIDEGNPKYLNSSETPIFHKGKNLYGLFEAKEAHKKSGGFPRLLVVEGYMDVVMLSQAGIDYAVATLGTATTPEHIRLLKQECHEVIFCFDGDHAGREAAARALKICLPFMTGELDLRFLFIPEGEDPDTLVQKEGKTAFEARLEQDALSLFDFMMKTLDADLNLQTIAGKSRWMIDAKPYLDALPQGPFKVFALNAIAKRFGFSLEQLEQQLDHASQPSLPTVMVRTRHQANLDFEDKALVLLIQNPTLAQSVDLNQIGQAQELLDMITLSQAQQFENTSHLLEFFRGKPEFEVLSALAVHPYSSLIEHIAQEWQDLLSKIGQANEIQERDNLQALSRIRTLTPAEKAMLVALLKR